ncbi:MAG: FAD:protein FMN transferase [Novosphingobium sp.]
MRPTAEDLLLLPPEVDQTPHCPAGVELAFGGAAFGTTWMARLVAHEPANATALKALCEIQLALIDAQMSPWIAESTLSRYNRLAPDEAADLPEPMRTVVDEAVALHALTGGAFDPFLGSAADLWGFGPQAVPEGLPDCAELRGLREGARPEWNGETLWRSAGFTLDLCGIAKGYAVDVLHDLLRAVPGISAVLVEIGGETRGFGIKPDTMPWWLELEWPGALGGRRAVAALHGWACASSGSDVRFFDHGGRRYSHSIDPATSEPSDSDLRGASVFDRHCWRADALATALIVMGSEEAREFADAQGIPCLLIPAAPSAEPILSTALQAWAADA